MRSDLALMRAERIELIDALSDALEASMNDNDLAREIERRLHESWEAGHRKRIKSPPKSNYASQIGHACPFYLWARRAHWEEMPPTPLDLRGIFLQGNAAEDGAIEDFKLGKFRFTEQQVMFEIPEHNIHGKIDGILGDDELNLRGLPCEITSVSTSSMLKQFSDFGDMIVNGSRGFIRKKPLQLLIYANMIQQRTGVLPERVAMVVMARDCRQYRVLIERPERYLDHIIEALGRVMLVNAGLNGGCKPKPIAYNPVWCDWCDAKSLCPTMQRISKGRDFVAINDPYLSETAQLLVDQKEAQAKYNKAKKELDKVFDLRKEAGTSRLFIFGKIRITVKWSKSGRKSPLKVEVCDE
jgi:hypothetical protein